MKNVFALQDGVTTPEKGRELPIKARNFAFQDPPARCPLPPPFLRLGYPLTAAFLSTPENNAIENSDVRASGRNGY